MCRWYVLYDVFSPFSNNLPIYIGKFTPTPCSGGLSCQALPLVNSPGTSIACTSDADAGATTRKRTTLEIAAYVCLNIFVSLLIIISF